MMKNHVRGNIIHEQCLCTLFMINNNRCFYVTFTPWGIPWGEDLVSFYHNLHYGLFFDQERVLLLDNMVKTPYYIYIEITSEESYE